MSEEQKTKKAEEDQAKRKENQHASEEAEIAEEDLDKVAGGVPPMGPPYP